VRTFRARLPALPLPQTLQGVWAHACLPVLLAFFLLSLAAAPARAGEPVAALSRVQGAVHLEARSGQGQRRLVDAGEPVGEGDSLLTGAKARAEITFRDGSVVTLSEDTHFTIRTFDQSAGLARFAMLRGAFRAVTGAIAGRDAPVFEIQTPLAAIGIRGTDFWGGFFSPEELGVFMAQGKGVSVSNPHGTRVITTPGEGVTVSVADPWPSRPVKWREGKVLRALRSVAFEAPEPRP